MISREAGCVTPGYHSQLLLFAFFHDLNALKNVMW